MYGWVEIRVHKRVDSMWTPLKLYVYYMYMFVFFVGISYVCIPIHLSVVMNIDVMPENVRLLTYVCGKNKDIIVLLLNCFFLCNVLYFLTLCIPSSSVKKWSNKTTSLTIGNNVGSISMIILEGMIFFLNTQRHVGSKFMINYKDWIMWKLTDSL